jgi:hypothetical protein
VPHHLAPTFRSERPQEVTSLDRPCAVSIPIWRRPHNLGAGHCIALLERLDGRCESRDAAAGTAGFKVPAVCSWGRALALPGLRPGVTRKGGEGQAVRFGPGRSLVR